MTYRNLDHISIPETKQLFRAWRDSIGDIATQFNTPEVMQLEAAISNLSVANLKVLHPLFIKSYRMPRIKYRNEPLKCTGLDVETNFKTGEPMLLGFWHPEVDDSYHYIHKPELKNFIAYMRDMVENTGVQNFVTWGKLDLQVIIRLFNPTESERERISRGIGATWQNGKFSARPPCLRTVNRLQVYLSHYIPGRALKIGYVDNGHNRTVWVFNCSQFWPKTIEQTAKGLRLEWRTFERETHLIDWKRFNVDLRYRNACIESNKQDARIVQQLTLILQERFHEIFDCYPSLLVSTGSITDAAVSRMLDQTENANDYQSNSWKWLVNNVWRDLKRPTIAEIETLLTEGFSGGYVDQFAIGYFDRVFTADISSAYPAVIRKLPDLRYSRLFVNDGSLEDDLKEIEALDYQIETAVIRGKCFIPDTLKYHPITCKTFSRLNYRPTGEFYSTYTLEERRYCEKYGATFSDETYVIVGLEKYVRAPIGVVSETLGDMRAAIRKTIDCKPESLCDECIVKDSQQYLVKIIDNSIYGKTVMTTESVEEINGIPQITGYVTGDRFNMLYGILITSRTRIILSEAAMQVWRAGGSPVLCMTDSLVWQGEREMLPSEMIRKEKTPGYFESPTEITEFYILKTGQYEYRNPYDHTFTYKVRGLAIDYQSLEGGKESFFHRVIKAHCEALPRHTNPKKITIKIKTRRLLTIGQHNLDNLAMIAEGFTEIKPFALSSKQTERYFTQWRECLDGHVFFKTPKAEIETSQPPLAWLHDTYINRVNGRYETQQNRIRATSRKTSKAIDEQKKLYVWHAMQLTETEGLPEGRHFRMTWSELEDYFGIPRSLIPGLNSTIGANGKQSPRSILIMNCQQKTSKSKSKPGTA